MLSINKLFKVASIKTKMFMINFLIIFGMAAFLFFFYHTFSDTLKREKMIQAKSKAEYATAGIQFFYDLSRTGKMEVKEAQEQAMNVLRIVRFGEYGYVWINNGDGDLLMQPHTPEKVGVNQLDWTDVNGKYIFREFIAKAKHGGGWVTYSWPKPRSTTVYPKVSYVSYFEPWDWVIGTGEYLDEMQKSVFWVVFNASAILFGIFILFFTTLFLVINYYIGLLKNSSNEILKQKEEIQEQAEELKLKNKKLIDLYQFKNGMTGMIVHDLKNPLNTIIGLSNEAEIQQAGKQMLNMVLNILDVQKFEDAELNLQWNFFPVSLAVNNSLKQVQLLYLKKFITIKSKISAKAILHADIDIVTRIIVNILTNAIKYTPNNGNITIIAEPELDSKFVKISISDTGSGIPNDNLKSIFDKFSQVEAKKSGGVASTGLGLTFCKLAVEAHGGVIFAESEVGKGADFWFLLPKSEELLTEPYEDNKITNKDNEPAIQLSELDLNLLSPYISQLKLFTVYEFSDIIGIINKIDSRQSNAINAWKSSIEFAVRSCNISRYKELLNV